MFNLKKINYSVIIVLILLVISGCNKVNPAEEIYEHLEKAVSLEADFEAQQAPLSKAENDEYEIYDEILGLSDLEEIQSLAQEALQLATSRKEMVASEKVSIEVAFEEFQLINPIVDTMEDQAMLDLTHQLIETMENRYRTYMELYKEYNVAVDLDIELYEIIQKEDLTIDELEMQHEKVNASYQLVNDFKDLFNQYTVQYNNLKREFYQLAELEVVYNE